LSGLSLREAKVEQMIVAHFFQLVAAAAALLSAKVVLDFSRSGKEARLG
jgi:hypothetical protein